MLPGGPTLASAALGNLGPACLTRYNKLVLDTYV